MNNAPFYEYLDALLRIQQVEQRQLAAALGLQAIHVQILAYLMRCNRYSDTLSVLCEYLGQTKGTVSTSVALLEKKGLLEKHADSKDKRISHLALSAEGREIARQAVKPWPGSEKQLSAQEKDSINAALQLLLRKAQLANDYRQFGACASCQHLQREEKRQRCGLTGETLQKTELQQICVHHSLA